MPPGTPSPLEMVILAVQDYIHRSSSATTMLRTHHTPRSRPRPCSTQAPIQGERHPGQAACHPPARRRYIAILPGGRVRIPGCGNHVKRRARGRASATSFLVERVDADAEPVLPVLSVSWEDQGPGAPIARGRHEAPQPPCAPSAQEALSEHSVGAPAICPGSIVGCLCRAAPVMSPCMIACMRVCLHACLRAFVRACLCPSVHVCLCPCVCVCVTV